MPDATTSASGSAPSASARSRRMTATAAAPSESCDALPAVMVPSDPNAGGSSASDAAVVPGRMPSSRSMPTPTISSAKRPLSRASAARWCERAAQASCSSREISSAALTSSEDSPMCWPVNVDHRPSWIIASTTSASPRCLPQRTLGSTYGALVIDSMPPATAVSISPSRMSWSA